MTASAAPVRKSPSRASICIAGSAFGGLAAVTIGQRASEWAVASQSNSLILIGAGALVGGVAAWLVSRPQRAAARTAA